MKIDHKELKKFFDKTFMSFVTEDDCLLLSSDAKIFDIEEHEKVPRDEKPSSVDFVFKGEVLLRHRSSGFDVRHVKTYETLELKSFLLRSQQYTYDWFAFNEAMILRIPAASFESILKKYPTEIDYLAKLTQSTSLQKLKKDFLAFGFSADYIKSIFLKLKVGSLKQYLELNQQKQHFLVSLSENLNVEVLKNGKKLPFTVPFGDAFLWNGDLDCIISDERSEHQIFYLSSEDLIKLSSHHLFLKVLNYYGSLVTGSKNKTLVDQSNHFLTISQLDHSKVKQDEALNQNSKFPVLKIKDLLEFMKDKKFFVAISAVTFCLSYVLSLALPLASQAVIDQSLGVGQINFLKQSIFLLLAAYALSVALDWYWGRINSYLSLVLSLRIKKIMGLSLLKRSQVISQNKFISTYFDTDALGQFIFNQFLPAFFNFFMMILTLTFVWAYHPVISMAVSAFIPVTFLILFLLSHQFKSIKNDFYQYKENEYSFFKKLFDQYLLARNHFESLSNRWKVKQVNQQMEIYYKNNSFFQFILQSVQLLKSEIIRIMVVILALKFYTKGEISLGQVIALTLIAPRISGQVQFLVNTIYQYFSIRAQLNNLSLVIGENTLSNSEYPTDSFSSITHHDDKHFNFDLKKIEINFVTTVKSDLNHENGNQTFNQKVTLNSGQWLALFSLNGQGKTSWSHQLSGVFSQSTQNPIQLNFNSKMNYMNRQTFEEKEIESDRFKFLKVEYLDDQATVFGQSYLYNITLNHHKSDLDKVYEILQFFEWQNEFSDKPTGLLHSVNSEGSFLSASQRIKLLILRCAYHRPDILIIDDTFRFLDPVSQQFCIRKLKQFLPQTIVIVMTSQVSIASGADLLAHLHQFKISDAEAPKK